MTNAMTAAQKFNFPIDAENALQLVADKRANYLAGLDARMEWERTHAAPTVEAQKDLASILDYLSGARVRGSKRDGSNADAFTLAYAIAHNIDFVAALQDKRVDGARLNVYAIPKMLGIMRVLNGSAFRDDSDDNTTAATILALVAGHTGGKAMWNAINETCSAWGMSGGAYGSGATQGGSTLRALASLGIVAKQGAGHAIVHAEYFKLLKAAAQKRAKRS